jgi:hypothetical protein
MSPVRSLPFLALWMLACGDPAALAPGAEVHVDDAVTGDLKGELQTVASAQVFFGHHSVGGDLLAGLAVLAKDAGVSVSLREGPVGNNGDPLGKMDDFAKQMETTAPQADIAAMKLCYVDFTPQTDVPALLTRYQESVRRVRAARPAVKLVHITAPLYARPTGVKTTVNRMLGRTVWEDSANKKRLEYNEGLKRAFPGEPLFDLAAFESTRPDGGHEAYVVDGKTVPMLWAGYTHDGGHLNDVGKRAGARAFVRVLAATIRAGGPGGQ